MELAVDEETLNTYVRVRKVVDLLRERGIFLVVGVE